MKTIIATIALSITSLIAFAQDTAEVTITETNSVEVIAETTGTTITVNVPIPSEDGSVFFSLQTAYQTYFYKNSGVVYSQLFYIKPKVYTQNNGILQRVGWNSARNTAKNEFPKVGGFLHKVLLKPFSSRVKLFPELWVVFCTKYR